MSLAFLLWFYLVVLMGRGTSTLLLILLAKITKMRFLPLMSLRKSPDKRHSPCHNLLPLFLGCLPNNFTSCLASLQALIAPYMLGVSNWVDCLPSYNAEVNGILDVLTPTSGGYKVTQRAPITFCSELLSRKEWHHLLLHARHALLAWFDELDEWFNSNFVNAPYLWKRKLEIQIYFLPIALDPPPQPTPKNAH